MDDVKWALGTILPRRADYALYRDYYRGRHRKVFELASEQHERYFRYVLERVRENLCKPVVRCFAERMSVDDWRGDGAQDAEAAAREHRLPALMNRTHSDALKLGDSYVMVWPPVEGQARLWRQNPEEVAVRTAPDDPNRVELAAKL